MNVGNNYSKQPTQPRIPADGVPQPADPNASQEDHFFREVVLDDLFRTYKHASYTTNDPKVMVERASQILENLSNDVNLQLSQDERKCIDICKNALNQVVSANSDQAQKIAEDIASLEDGETYLLQNTHRLEKTNNYDHTYLLFEKHGSEIKVWEVGEYQNRGGVTKKGFGDPYDRKTPIIIGSGTFVYNEKFKTYKVKELFSRGDDDSDIDDDSDSDDEVEKNPKSLVEEPIDSFIRRVLDPSKDPGVNSSNNEDFGFKKFAHIISYGPGRLLNTAMRMVLYRAVANETIPPGDLADKAVRRRANARYRCYRVAMDCSFLKSFYERKSQDKSWDAAAVLEFERALGKLGLEIENWERKLTAAGDDPSVAEHQLLNASKQLLNDYRIRLADLQKNYSRPMDIGMLETCETEKVGLERKEKNLEIFARCKQGIAMQAKEAKPALFRKALPAKFTSVKDAREALETAIQVNSLELCGEVMRRMPLPRPATDEAKQFYGKSTTAERAAIMALFPEVNRMLNETGALNHKGSSVGGRKGGPTQYSNPHASQLAMYFNIFEKTRIVAFELAKYETALFGNDLQGKTIGHSTFLDFVGSPLCLPQSAEETEEQKLIMAYIIYEREHENPPALNAAGGPGVDKSLNNFSRLFDWRAEIDCHDPSKGYEKQCYGRFRLWASVISKFPKLRDYLKQQMVKEGPPKYVYEPNSGARGASELKISEEVYPDLPIAKEDRELVLLLELDSWEFKDRPAIIAGIPDDIGGAGDKNGRFLRNFFGAMRGVEKQELLSDRRTKGFDRKNVKPVGTYSKAGAGHNQNSAAEILEDRRKQMGKQDDEYPKNPEAFTIGEMITQPDVQTPCLLGYLRQNHEKLFCDYGKRDPLAAQRQDGQDTLSLWLDALLRVRRIDCELPEGEVPPVDFLMESLNRLRNYSMALEENLKSNAEVIVNQLDEITNDLLSFYWYNRPVRTPDVRAVCALFHIAHTIGERLAEVNPQAYQKYILEKKDSPLNPETRRKLIEELKSDQATKDSDELKMMLRLADSQCIQEIVQANEKAQKHRVLPDDLLADLWENIYELRELDEGKFPRSIGGTLHLTRPGMHAYWLRGQDSKQMKRVGHLLLKTHFGEGNFQIEKIEGSLVKFSVGGVHGELDLIGGHFTLGGDELNQSNQDLYRDKNFIWLFGERPVDIKMAVGGYNIDDPTGYGHVRVVLPKDGKPCRVYREIDGKKWLYLSRDLFLESNLPKALGSRRWDVWVNEDGETRIEHHGDMENPVYSTIKNGASVLPGTGANSNLTVASPELLKNSIFARFELEKFLLPLADSQGEIQAVEMERYRLSDGQVLRFEKRAGQWVLANDPAWRITTAPQTDSGAPLGGISSVIYLERTDGKGSVIGPTKMLLPLPISGGSLANGSYLDELDDLVPLAEAIYRHDPLGQVQDKIEVHTNLARFRMAMELYKTGDYQRAFSMLDQVEFSQPLTKGEWAELERFFEKMVLVIENPQAAAVVMKAFSVWVRAGGDLAPRRKEMYPYYRHTNSGLRVALEEYMRGFAQGLPPEMWLGQSEEIRVIDHILDSGLFFYHPATSSNESPEGWAANLQITFALRMRREDLLDLQRAQRPEDFIGAADLDAAKDEEQNKREHEKLATAKVLRRYRYLKHNPSLSAKVSPNDVDAGNSWQPKFTATNLTIKVNDVKPAKDGSAHINGELNINKFTQQERSEFGGKLVDYLSNFNGELQRGIAASQRAEVLAKENPMPAQDKVLTTIGEIQKARENYVQQSQASLEQCLDDLNLRQGYSTTVRPPIELSDLLKVYGLAAGKPNGRARAVQYLRERGVDLAGDGNRTVGQQLDQVLQRIETYLLNSNENRHLLRLEEVLTSLSKANDEAEKNRLWNEALPLMRQMKSKVEKSNAASMVLLFEAMTGIRPRPDQELFIGKIEEAIGKGDSILIQQLMGSGKTKVNMPFIIFLTSLLPGKFPIVVSHSSQLPAIRMEFAGTLQSMVGVGFDVVQMDYQQMGDVQAMRNLVDRLRDARETGNRVLVFESRTLEALRTYYRTLSAGTVPTEDAGGQGLPAVETVRGLEDYPGKKRKVEMKRLDREPSLQSLRLNQAYQELFEICKESGVAILDEVHRTLDPKEAYITQPAAAHKGQLEVTDLEIVNRVIEHFPQEIIVKLQTNRQESLRRDELKELFRKYLESELSELLPLEIAENGKKDLIDFILGDLDDQDEGKVAAFQDLLKGQSEEQQHAICLLRGLFTQYFPQCLGKNYNQHYGFNGEGQCVPFWGVGVPSPNFFQNPYETVVYLFLSAKIGGIPSSALSALARSYYKMALSQVSDSLPFEETPAAIYFAKLFKGLKNPETGGPLTLDYFKDGQCTEEANGQILGEMVDHLRNNPEMQRSVLIHLAEAQANFSRTSFACTPVILPSFFNSCVGMSGTVSNREVYDIKLSTNIQAQEGSLGRLVNKINNDLKAGTSKILTLQRADSATGILTDYREKVGQDGNRLTNVRALIDTAGMLKSQSNRESAQQIAKFCRENDIDVSHVEFYDTEKKAFCLLAVNQPSDDPVVITGKDSRPPSEKLFVFYDQARATGSDAPLWKQARCIATVNFAQTNAEDAQQGFMRARQYIDGEQTLDIVASEEGRGHLIGAQQGTDDIDATTLWQTLARNSVSNIVRQQVQAGFLHLRERLNCFLEAKQQKLIKEGRWEDLNKLNEVAKDFLEIEDNFDVVDKFGATRKMQPAQTILTDYWQSRLERLQQKLEKFNIQDIKQEELETLKEEGNNYIKKLGDVQILAPQNRAGQPIEQADGEIELNVETETESEIELELQTEYGMFQKINYGELRHVGTVFPQPEKQTNAVDWLMKQHPMVNPMQNHILEFDGFSGDENQIQKAKAAYRPYAYFFGPDVMVSTNFVGVMSVPTTIFDTFYQMPANAVLLMWQTDPKTKEKTKKVVFLSQLDAAGVSRAIKAGKLTDCYLCTSDGYPVVDGQELPADLESLKAEAVVTAKLFNADVDWLEKHSHLTAPVVRKIQQRLKENGYETPAEQRMLMKRFVHFRGDMTAETQAKYHYAYTLQSGRESDPILQRDYASLGLEMTDPPALIGERLIGLKNEMGTLDEAGNNVLADLNRRSGLPPSLKARLQQKLGVDLDRLPKISPKRKPIVTKKSAGSTVPKKGASVSVPKPEVVTRPTRRSGFLMKVLGTALAFFGSLGSAVAGALVLTMTALTPLGWGLVGFSALLGLLFLSLMAGFTIAGRINKE